MRDLYAYIKQQLKEAGIDQPEQDARRLLGDVLGLRDADLIAGDIPEPTPAQRDRLDALLARLLAGEPLGRVLGYQDFWGLRFALSPDTLEPRMDTETLVDVALRRFAGTPPRRILDIGTGSGCILIALLHEWPEAEGVGTDLSPGAIDTARRNAESNGVDARASFVQTRWAAGVAGNFDLIVSNPPYIASGIIPDLDGNVRRYDPILALDGGADGLDAYRFILTETKNLLAPGGLVLFEIGYDQGESVPRLVAEYGATPAPVIRDPGGNPRVVECRMGISKKTLARDS